MLKFRSPGKCNGIWNVSNPFSKFRGQIFQSFTAYANKNKFLCFKTDIVMLFVHKFRKNVICASMGNELGFPMLKYLGGGRVSII